MTGTDPRLERLKIELELKRAALFEHRTQLFELQTDLERFIADYQKGIGALEDELEAVKQEISAARSRKLTKPETGWAEGGSFAEYLNQRWYPVNERIEPIKPKPDEDELRAVYRRLARKFHPDTTTDPDQQGRLSVIMARINAAYSAKDIQALREFDQTPIDDVLESIPGTGHEERWGRSLDESLREQSRMLDDEIAWTRHEYQALMSSSWAALKIEVSLARSRGRDLLREMAEKLRAELSSARAELSRLKGNA